MLMNHMDVVVMLPASLRDNYINEIYKCGSSFYNKNQYWVFVDEKPIVQKAKNKLKIPDDIIKKHKGIWIPIKHDGKMNYDTLDSQSQEQITNQMHSMIQNRYNFINYNGLQEKSIRKMVNDNENPFDNKTIIVDEIHNLVSRIVNGRKIGTALYKLLMNAKNSKIILLSGTPVINYPHELSFILNLLAGPQVRYELKANKGSPFSKDDIEQIVIDNIYVDDFSIEVSTQKIILSLLPEGFRIVDRKTSKIERSPDIIQHPKILEDIVDTLQSSLKMKIST